MVRQMILGLLTAAALVGAQPAIEHNDVKIEPLGRPGAFTGFRLMVDGAGLVDVNFGSLGNITAQRCSARKTDRGQSLAFERLQARPTPQLGRDSTVTVALLPDRAFPRVSFRLELKSFDQAAWEKAQGQVPFHFLTCSLPGAEIFHQRGWPIPTPAIDPYPLLSEATGYGIQIRSFWSKNWSYAPPVGASPMPTVGLWKAGAKTYVGYDFHESRLRDHSEKDIGTAYCWKHKGAREFFTLVWPFAQHYRELRYPEEAVVVQSYFNLLYSKHLASDDDPNRFVSEFVWKHFADLLPAAPTLNDLSWLPGTNRPTEFRAPGPWRLYGVEGEKARWFTPGTIVARGVHYFSPIDSWYRTNNGKALRQLKSDIDFLLPYAIEQTIDGDRCVFWKKPLEGEGAKMFAAGVPTLHNIQGWAVALALLDTYRNEPQQEARLLPYIDGALRYTKHILYTRNGYADVPAAQFAWGATPVATFCLRYYYTFRDTPERRELAQLALKLARNMTYRYMAIWTSDNDDMDEIDSSFLMEPNAGHSWLGSACSNEVWVVTVALAEVYCATGDPLLGYYLRGMVERWHELYRDNYAGSIKAYRRDNLTERYGLYAECAQGKGVRGDFGGIWGQLELIAWPMGSAVARVICGEQAALAFDRDGLHTNIDQYRYYGDGQFSFRVTRVGPMPKGPRSFDLQVTFPFFVLTDKPVQLISDGQARTAEIVKFEHQPSTLTVKGVQYGDIVAVGKYDAQVKPKACALAKPRRIVEARARQERGCTVINLEHATTTTVSRDWNDLKSYAGLEPGRKLIYGIPFDIPVPDPQTGTGSVRDRDVALGIAPRYLFALVGPSTDQSRLDILLEGNKTQSVDLRDAVPVLRGWPPIFEWHVDLVAVETKGRKVASLRPTNLDLFAITATDKTKAELAETFAALAARRKAVLAERETLRELRELRALAAPFAGHIAVLPTPKTKARQSIVGRMLWKAGMREGITLLTPEQLVSPQFFAPSRFWLALYLGSEDYYQTVRREGDAEEAVRRYLSRGGTLLVLPSGPFPFYYNEKGKADVAAGRVGLPVCGSGAKGRDDKLPAAQVSGWEKPPEGVKLTFELNTEQEIIKSLPARFPFPETGDLRWRPITNVAPDAAKYTPLFTLRDEKGNSYGDGGALIEYTKGPLAGGRVLYIWATLLKDREYQKAVLGDTLRWAFRNTIPPPASGTCTRATGPIKVDGRLDEADWAAATPVSLDFLAPKGGPIPVATKARFLWDDENLYVGFVCDDTDIRSLKKTRDDALWEEEVVEVFVDPDGDGKDYKEFEINPLNTQLDLLIREPGKGPWQDNAKWNAADWQSAVHVEGTANNPTDDDARWTVETAIPLKCFDTARRLPPHVGDTWRVNLYRKERGKALGDEQAALCWSAVTNMHQPKRFGFMTFGASPLHDDFSLYQPGSSGAPTWRVSNGQWTVEDGVLVGTDCVIGGWIAEGARCGASDWRDYTFRCRFRIAERGTDHRDGAWFGVRYGGPGSCYSVNFINEKVRLHKSAGGRSTGDDNMLAEAQWQTDDRWHEVEITVRGSRLSVKLDGQRKIDAEDRDHLGAPPIEAGGIALCARRWPDSKGHTRVMFDDVSTTITR